MAQYAEAIPIMDRVEAIFNRDRPGGVKEIEGELTSLGFVQRGGDPAVIVMEHPTSGLLLEIDLTEEGAVHGYTLLPAAEVDRRQEKYRW